MTSFEKACGKWGGAGFLGPVWPLANNVQQCF